jgi:ABC-2 type transport system permease protein
VTAATAPALRPYRPVRSFGAILWRDVFVTAAELPVAIAQMVLQPFLLMFVFGRILVELGYTRPGYLSVLVPGVITISVVITSMESTALSLVIDFGVTREIEDRLLAPLPVWLVGLEKIVYAALRALIAGLVMVPVALLVVPDWRPDLGGVPLAVGFAVLGALAGAAIGLTLGTLVKPSRISVMFVVVLTPLLFTGCGQYPWVALAPVRWFQLLTLANPMTYASEGMRAALAPGVPHLAPGLAAGLLAVSLAVFVGIGLRGFARRATD